MSKIVLVDDDATLRTLLKTLLEMEGFQTVAAVPSNEENLLGLLKTECPDVLLMDVNMNRVSGIDILRRIKQDQRFVDLQIIMSSGSDVGQRCLQAGADGFLMKPFMPEELFSLLRSAAG